MNIKSEISRQFHSLRNVLIFLQIPAGLIMLLVLFLKLRFDIDTSDLTQDPNSVAGQPFYIGLISNLGVIFWGASAAVSIFAGLIGKSKAPSAASFLIYSGIFSALLLLDDLLQLHEGFFQYDLHIPEELVLALYSAIAILIYFRHRKFILPSQYFILLSSLMFFGFSLSVDTFLDDIPGENLLEDGSKFIGILTWFGYYTSLGYETIRQKISST
ncbi:MAG: hypothetical protein HY864_03130 [Chloroflexi bacterium]|nr:hypothetical protein [Chloroflexota bacterium]